MVAIAALLLCVSIAGVVVAYMAFMKPAQVINPPPDQTEWDLSLPLRFAINDKWQGDVMGATDTITKTIYDMNLNQKEQLTTTTVQTTNIYKPGTQWWVLLGETRFTAAIAWFKYYKITIPMAPSSDSAVHDLDFDFYTCGNYSTNVLYPNGTAVPNVADGDGGWTAISLTSLHKAYMVNGASAAGTGTEYPAFTVSFVENVTTADYGYMDSEDPVYGVSRIAAIEVHMQADGTLPSTNYTGGNRLLLTSIPLIYSAASTDKYYAQSIPADSLVRDTNPDGSIKSTGIASFVLSFNAAGMLAGDQVGIVIQLYFHTDLNYFKTYGSHPTLFDTSMNARFIFAIRHG